MAPDFPTDPARTPCVRRRALERRGPLAAAGDLRPLWFVTATICGPSLTEDVVRVGLHRLNENLAFLVSTRYDQQRAEIRYWDEGASVAETTRLALALWSERVVAAVLPGWQLHGISVLDRLGARQQWLTGPHPTVVELGEVVPFDARPA